MGAAKTKSALFAPLPRLMVFLKTKFRWYLLVEKPVIYSAEVDYCGTSWTVCAKKQADASGTKWLGLLLACNREFYSNSWSCVANFSIQLDRAEGYGRPVRKAMENTRFDYGSRSGIGFPFFVEWDLIIDSEHGYTVHQDLQIEAKIQILKISGLPNPREIDFSSPNSLSDAVLVVEGREIHVHRQFLAILSPYFAALFFGKFEESSCEKIQIESVDLEAFVAFLGVLYRSGKALSASNIALICSLADRFDVETVRSECVRFLTETNEVSVEQKLILANKYGYCTLEDACIRSFSSWPSLTSLDHNSLPNKTKALLFDRLIQL